MRKIKTLIISFIVLLALLIIPFANIEAHSVELDPENLISMPLMIMNGKGTISISSSVTNYTLYFQAVEIEKSTFSQIQTINDNGQKELKTIKEAYDALEVESKNLKTIYNEKEEAYKQGQNSTTLSEDELEQLKTARDTALTNYNNKVTECNNKATEYNNKAKEIQSEIYGLTPMYVESNWTQTNNKEIYIDISNFNGEKTFVVWAKLVTSGDTYYDEMIYTTNGTKNSNINVTGVSLDKTSLSITEGSSYTLKVTITPSDATNKNVVWTSDNESVAKVENGTVTGMSAGSATITATTKDGDYKATCKVIVNKKSTTSTTEDEKEIVDNTLVNADKLPQAGNYSFILIGAIVVLAILGFVFFNKIRHMEF